ncbi:hypothetical protein KACHI17_01990 [Sediminibacterium sp. KACHI17]|uniref:Uncharacterized protein n=1 Tax=Sediminibacterium sp. KACHI17 TaxID=1751071 RepID=A0AAT9GFN0_9BACT
MQGLTQDGDEKEVDDRDSCEAAQEDTPESGSFTFFIDHFGVTKPFRRALLEDGLKKTIVHKQSPEKYPSEIQIWISPITNVKSPALVQADGQEQDHHSVDQKIQGTGTFTNFSHGAKLVCSE